MRALRQDVRYGICLLLKTPGLTVVAALTLGLGIGASTAIFSVVHAVLLRPLPFKDPGRLVVLWEKTAQGNRDRNFVSPADFLDWQDQNRVFEGMAAIRDVHVNLSGGPGNHMEPEELPAQQVSAEWLAVLGVQPVLGRAFRPEEDCAGRDAVVVLSHRLWRRRFGGDPSIIGKVVQVNSQSRTVLGVMPPDFHLINARAELWAPLALNRHELYRVTGGRYLTGIARLKPGVTLARAQAEMEAIGRRLEQVYPAFNAGWNANLIPLREELVGDARPALLVLLGAVTFLLLIACANAANLLLAQAAARQREIAIRAALGAGRARVVRQLLTESVLLAGLGGGLGLMLALCAMRLVAALGPRNIPRLADVRLDAALLGFTLGISVLTGILFGLMPALAASRANLQEALKEGGRGASASRLRRRLRSLLVVAEMGLAVVLLIAAGLMVRSFLRLQAVSPGFRTHNVLTMRVLLLGGRNSAPQRRAAFVQEALERIGRLPGVRSAGAVTFLPLAGFGSGVTFWTAGRPAPPAGERPAALVRAVDRNYFQTIGIPLRRGRLFTDRDNLDGPRVILINETMARLWGSGSGIGGSMDPIGERVALEWREPVTAEVVGVVGDVKADAPNTETWPTIYCPYPQLAGTAVTLVVRTAQEPMGMAAAVARQIHALDPELPVGEVRSMEQVLAESTASQRFNTLLLAVFAAVALVLGAVGIYSVMRYTVTERTQEIGLRMALGAQPRDVFKLVVGQGALLALAGIGLGLAAAFGLTRLMASLLYGVTATDAATFVGIPVFLAAVALLASYLPAARAIRMHPLAALRHE